MTRRQGNSIHDALDALFVDGELPEGTDAASLHQKISEDDTARRRYDRLAHAARELEGADEGRSRFEKTFAEESFIGALDALLDAEEPPDNVIKPAAFFRNARPLIMLAASCALVAGAYAALQGTTPENDEFQARSAVTHTKKTHRAMFDAPRVDVFCVSRDEHGAVHFARKEDAPFEVLHCPIDAEIKLAHSPTHRDLTHAAMFGVDRRGDILWYGPSPANPDAITIEGAGDLAPFGESIRLGVNHSPGPVRVHAIFSNRPIDYAKLEQIIANQRGRDLFSASAIEHDEHSVATSTTFDVTTEANR